MHLGSPDRHPAASRHVGEPAPLRAGERPAGLRVRRPYLSFVILIALLWPLVVVGLAPPARADGYSGVTLAIPEAPSAEDQSEGSAETAAPPHATGEAAVADGLRPVPVPQPPKPLPGEPEPVEFLVAPPSPPEEAPDAAAAKEAGQTVASAPPPFESLRVVFGEESADIDTTAETGLIEVAGFLNQHETQRVVLHAHAARSGRGNSHDRRLSLSRALAVRAFLVDKGVPASRIALRPLGSEFKDGPPDRVDILPLRP